jgi:deazaflavin-dependent oxidoreductase (nitroreductase family)
MPFRTRVVRPFANRVINPVTRRFAGRLPGFGVVTHTGRRSGRSYRIPINVFRRADQFVFALTYGSRVDWVQNVLAAGRCELRVRGRNLHLDQPNLIVDPEASLTPMPVRLFLRLLRVSEFLVMKGASA